MNKITEYYQQQGYRIVQEFNLSDTRSFLTEQMRKRNFYNMLFFISVFAGGVGLGVGMCFLWSESAGIFDFTGNALSVIGTGMLLFCLLIPLHEIVHGIAFKICGVSKVCYGVQWSQLLFYAAADGVAITLKQYRFVALLPLIAITTVLIVILILSNGLLTGASVYLALVLHLTCCGGDLALLGYFSRFKGRDVISIDDVGGGVSYFLER